MQIDVNRIPALIQRGASLAYDMRHDFSPLISFEEWLEVEHARFKRRQPMRLSGLLEHWTLSAKNDLRGPIDDLPPEDREALAVANLVFTALLRMEPVALGCACQCD